MAYHSRQGDWRRGHGAALRRSHSFGVLVEYEYTVAGIRRTSRTIGLGSTRGSGTSTDHSGEITPLFSANHERDARALASDYPVGKVVKVYHHPERHEISCLEPGDPRLIDFVAAMLPLLIIGLGFTIGGAVMVRRAKGPPLPPLPA